MRTLSERLQASLDRDKTKSKAGLARACGISKGAVTAWFDGTAISLQGKNLFSAAIYLGVNPAWLQIGQGPMTPDEKAAHALPSPPEHVDIPMLIGDGVFPLSNMSIEFFGLNPKPLRAYIGDDDAMLPRVGVGTLMLIDISDKTPNGYIYAIRYGSKIKIRRLVETLKGIRITSDSDDKNRFPDEIAEPGQIEVIGRVVYVTGKI